MKDIKLMAITFSVALALPLAALAAGEGKNYGATGQSAEQGEQHSEMKSKRTDGTGASMEGKQAGMKQDKGAPVASLKDVETLNDNAGKYVGKRISVVGEIKNKVDGRSVVLESIGIFDDEIVVLAPKDLEGQGFANLKEDTKVKITGTLRTASLMDIRQEYSWDLDPQMEMEFEGVTAYLVADQIEPMEKSE